MAGARPGTSPGSGGIPADLSFSGDLWMQDPAIQGDVWVSPQCSNERRQLLRADTGSVRQQQEEPRETEGSPGWWRGPGALRGTRWGQETVLGKTGITYGVWGL